MKKFYDFLVRHKDFIELITNVLSFLVAIFGSIFLAALALQASNRANEISQSAAMPYFEISSVSEDARQSAYLLHNNGGYILDATVTLQSILSVHLNNNAEDFHFAYETLSQDFSNLKGEDITICLDNTFLGLQNWIDQTNSTVEGLITEFEERDLSASIFYSEYLTIKYMDVNRNTRQECYLVSVSDTGELYLSFLSQNDADAILSATNTDTLIRSYVYGEDTSIQVAHSGRLTSGHRVGLRRDMFLSKVLETIDGYLNDCEEITP